MVPQGGRTAARHGGSEAGEPAGRAGAAGGGSSGGGRGGWWCATISWRMDACQFLCCFGLHNVLAYPTCPLAPLLPLALVTHTVPTLVPFRCRSVWGSCASRWRSEKTAPSPRWSGRCANSVPLGLFEPPPRLTCSHDCSRRAPNPAGSSGPRPARRRSNCGSSAASCRTRSGTCSSGSRS